MGSLLTLLGREQKTGILEGCSKGPAPTMENLTAGKSVVGGSPKDRFDLTGRNSPPHEKPSATRIAGKKKRGTWCERGSKKRGGWTSEPEMNSMGAEGCLESPSDLRILDPEGAADRTRRNRRKKASMKGQGVFGMRRGRLGRETHGWCRKGVENQEGNLRGKKLFDEKSLRQKRRQPTPKRQQRLYLQERRGPDDGWKRGEKEG